MSEYMEEILEYKVICDKHEIILEKVCNKSSAFRLRFHSSLPFASMTKLSIESFYELLANVNSDIIRNIAIISCDSVDSVDLWNIELTFEPFSKNFGISAKSMSLALFDKTIDHKLHYIGKSNKNNSDSVICNHSEFIATRNSNGNTDISYIFDLEIDEDLPLYLQNIVGLLMKKIFFRLKQFLER